MSFRLGSFSRAGMHPFAGLVLGDAVAVLASLNLPLRGAASLLAVLNYWDENFAALSTLPADPAKLDVPLLPLADLRVHAPYVPRQTFCTIANYRSHLIDTVRDPALTPALGEPDTAECLQRGAA